MTAGYGKMLHLPIYPDDSHNQQQGQDTDHTKIKEQTVVLLLLHSLIGKIYENEQLQMSNHIKEEYIGRFLKLCSTYIDRLDAYRRMVNKKLSGGQTEELLKMVRSQEMCLTLI